MKLNALIGCNYAVRVLPLLPFVNQRHRQVLRPLVLPIMQKCRMIHLFVSPLQNLRRKIARWKLIDILNKNLRIHYSVCMKGYGERASLSKVCQLSEMGLPRLWTGGALKLLDQDYSPHTQTPRPCADTPPPK